MNSTEEKILLAAEQIFMKDGYDGSRMQKIADLAGINKAMLHYYFRSKDALFERIFKEKFNKLFPEIEGQLNSEKRFIDKVCVFAEKYVDFTIDNPYLPLFVINNINKNAEFAQNLPYKLPQILLSSFLEDAEKGYCKNMNPAHLFMSILGICIFPFLGKSMLKVVFGMSDEDFIELMQHRKAEIQTQIRILLTPES
jgi:TetR/AcrR family transcriptional regulator